MKQSWVTSPNYRLMIEMIRATRAGQGVSQRELARRLKKPPSFVNKIETMERRLDLLEFMIIAEAIGLKPEQWVSQIRVALPEDLTF